MAGIVCLSQVRPCSPGCAGCQRFEVVSHPGTELRWNVRILADSPTPRVPVQAQQGAAAWAPWAWAQSDAWALAEAARALFAETAPEVSAAHGHVRSVKRLAVRELQLSGISLNSMQQ